MTVPGLVCQTSPHSFADTLRLLTGALRDAGLNEFSRIDHSGVAVRAGFQLRPTELSIFGNPKAGTPLMEAAPTIAIDLPQKILVWQDDDDLTWLGYNSPLWLGERHGLTVTEHPQLAAMTTLLENVIATVIAQKQVF